MGTKFRITGVPGFGITFDAEKGDKIARLHVSDYEEHGEGTPAEHKPFNVSIEPTSWDRLILRGVQGVGVRLETVRSSGVTTSDIASITGPLREFVCEVRPATVENATYVDPSNLAEAPSIVETLATLKEGTNPVPTGGGATAPTEIEDED